MLYLVNPDEHRILEHAGDRVPLGLLSIAAHVDNVKVFDLNHTDLDDFMDEFQADQPETVGISIYTSSIAREAKELAGLLKGRTRLIAGGHHATVMPNDLVNDFDAIVRGEAEQSIHIARYRHGIIKAQAPDLTKTRSLKWDALEMKDYGMDQSGKRTGTLITSRGCCYSCAFCGKMYDWVRKEPTEKVKEQIQDLKDMNFEAVYFLDDLFTADQERMRKIVKSIDMPFRVTTRANLVNKEKLKILADEGCEWLSIGIESGNNDILKNSGKMMTTTDNFKAVKLASKYGIKTKGFFIFGLPGETETTAKQTLDFSLFLKQEGLTKADFYFLTPFPGTNIWKNPGMYGIEITDRDYTKYLVAGKGAKCYVNTQGLKSQQIEDFVTRAKQEWI